MQYILFILLFWYVGYLLAFHVTISRCVADNEPINKWDIKTIKTMCLMSWLWIYIVFTEK